jgi:hypothetical protein
MANELAAVVSELNRVETRISYLRGRKSGLTEELRVRAETRQAFKESLAAKRANCPKELQCTI